MSSKFKEWHDMPIGSIWKPCGDNNYRVVIKFINKDIVVYRDLKDHSMVWDREPWAFQVRYSQIENSFDYEEKI